MDMDQLQKNLEKSLDQLDVLTKERDNLKDKYEDAKDYIEKLKEKIEHIRSKKESKDQTKDCNEVSRLKKENEILKHGLDIKNLYLSLKDDDKKIESYLRFENSNMRFKLVKMTSELESSKLHYAELEKYNTL